MFAVGVQKAVGVQRGVAMTAGSRAAGRAVRRLPSFAALL